MSTSSTQSHAMQPEFGIVCVLPRNLEKGFISPFVEHIAGKNDFFFKKKLANLKNFLVAEKAQPYLSLAILKFLCFC